MPARTRPASPPKTSGPWRNRIVGYSEEPTDTLLANPGNWRVHGQPQQDALAGLIREVGLVQNIICNRTTGRVVDGHLRVMLALRDEQPTVPVTWVELSEAEEAEVLATLDPVAAMAGADAQKLEELLREVQTGEAGVQALLAELYEQYLGGEDQEPYTRKIEAPTYEPTGEKPAVSELFDAEKTRTLIAEIDRAEGLSEDERAFLRIAAQRHTVLRFNLIAEYYAHAPEPVQRLMEQSALVIIDFDKAIELGYVQLSSSLAEQVRDEYGD